MLRAPAGGPLAAAGLSFVATEDGPIVGTVRLWDVSAGPGRRALLLGPLAVSPEHQSTGIGGKLMKQAIATARMRGHGAILLVGDAPYYGRFGFSAEKTGSLWMPGPYRAGPAAWRSNSMPARSMGPAA